MQENSSSITERDRYLLRYEFINTADPNMVGRSMDEKMFEKRRITLLEAGTDKTFRYSLFGFPSSFIISSFEQPSHLTESLEPLNSLIIATTNVGSMTDFTQTQPEKYYPGEALIMSPGENVELLRSSNFSGLGVIILHEKLSEYFNEVYGIRIQKPIKFKRRIDMNSGTAKSLSNLVHFICLEAADESSALSLGMTKDDMENLMIKTIINCIPHSYSEQLEKTHPPGRPVYVRNVVDHVMSNLNKRITLDDLVNVSGVSARTLQLGFKDSFGVSPMTFVRDVRLKRSHEQLLRAAPGSTSIAEVAEAWQFQHHSQFSKIYQKRFGELPSKTLNR